MKIKFSKQVVLLSGLALMSPMQIEAQVVKQSNSSTRYEIAGGVIGLSEKEPLAVTPTITPYVYDGTGWKQTTSLTVLAHKSFRIGPQASPDGGTWQWRGPNNFTSNDREIGVSNVTAANSGDYVVTYTKDGAQATATFRITVSQPPVITPYVNDGTGWKEERVLTAKFGESFWIGPQANLNGSWHWEGPEGFTSNEREITIDNVAVANGGEYVLTFTADNGLKTSMSFVVTVDADVRPTAINSKIFDWAGQLGVNDDRVKGGELIQRYGDVYVLAKDLDGVGGSRRAIAIVNKSGQQQKVIVSGQHLGYEKYFQIDGAEVKYALNVNVPANSTRVYTLVGERREQSRFEAENAAINDYENNSLTANNRFGNVFQEYAPLSSNGYIVGWLGYFPNANNGKPADNYLVWNNVYSKTGGEYFVTLNYFTSIDRGAALYVNGHRVQEWEKLNSGGNEKAASVTVKVLLKKGLNTIKVGHAGNAGSAQIDVPQIDYVDVVRAFNLTDATKTTYYKYGHEVMQKAKELYYGLGSGDEAYQWFGFYQKGNSDNGGAQSIWPQGFGLATTSEFAKAARGTGDFITYNEMSYNLASVFPSFVGTYEGRTCWMMRPGYGHRFTDDDAWGAVGLLEAYELDHRQFYLDQLRLFGEWAWGLWDDKGNGGMYWQDAPRGDDNYICSKNSANNNPTCVIFTRLYEYTGEKVWLDRAIKTYDWIYEALVDKDDMQAIDGINVVTNGRNTYKAPYNEGSYINAAVVLYRATGEQKYLDHAIACANRLNGSAFENYNSSQLGNIRIAKDAWNTLGRDIVVVARGYEELNKVINNRTFINSIKSSVLNAYLERRDAECGLIKDGWKGNKPQVFDGKNDYYEGLTQLGFLEMFARMAMDEDYLAQLDANNNAKEFEAENATKSGDIPNIDDNAASNGKYVGSVGNGRSLTIHYDAPEDGAYSLELIYCADANRNFTVTTNGNTQELRATSTGSWSPSSLGSTTTFVSLKRGDNTIVISGNGDTPNFDKFVITPLTITDQTGIVIDEVTAVNRIGADYLAAKPIYNVNGQYVGTSRANLQKGVYIIDGKKFVVK